MTRHIWIRIKRKPLVFLAILLFTAMIALALCGLHRGNDNALAQYNNIYHKIDVRCTVTNLAGNQSDRLDTGPACIALFTKPGEFSNLLEDVQIKGSVEIQWNGESYALTGITSSAIEPKLWPENGCTVFWNENADRDFFGGSEMACIIPQALQKKMQEENLPADTFPLHIAAAFPKETDYDADMKILATYKGTNDKIIYCPWSTYVSIVNTMGRNESADSLHATLRDNDLLPVLRQTASRHFAQPNPSNAGLEMIGTYYLALDINDSQLSQAKTNLENSMAVNRIVAVLVLAFSAAAGALIGFLMIRSRKKEIILMRTMGTSGNHIYIGFVTEQMVFAILGAVVGGFKYTWHPVPWLILFICVYFLGLSAALLVMLRKNLLTTIKEDE